MIATAGGMKKVRSEENENKEPQTESWGGAPGPGIVKGEQIDRKMSKLIQDSKQKPRFLQNF